MAGEERLRVAIVGLGPKGLFALERLLHHARLGPPAAFDIDVFEPSEHPGAGPVYDPSQPAYLRMNLAADRLTLWPGGSLAVGDDERLSFVQWRARETGDIEGERFPPRAQVGRYLAWGLGAMLRAAPPDVRVKLRRSEVISVGRYEAGWRVSAAAAASEPTSRPAAGPGPASRGVAGAGTGPGSGSRGTAGAGSAPCGTADPGADHYYDEILLATGHARSHRSFGDVPAVFPVERWLSPDRVPAGTTVAVRGFALTFIDAALALTEGRGGTFEPGDHPYRLRYEPSAKDAGLILPFSRSGRPMLAKPEPQLAAGVPGLEAIMGCGRDEILALAPGFGVRDELLAILASTVAASLVAATCRAPSGEPLRDATGARSGEPPHDATFRARSGEPPHDAIFRARSCEPPRDATGGARSGEPLRDAERAAQEWLRAACDGHSPLAGMPATAELERSLAVGASMLAPDLSWALGHVWRGVYPALVARLGGAAMSEREWPVFRRLAAQMERVAFGPPAINAAKLLALVEAGRVDLTHVAGGRIATGAGPTSLGSDHGARAVDLVIDAVLPAPGAAGSPLLAALVAGGYARIARGHRGLDVTPDARCLGRDGAPAEGLSAIGRPTEDSVIGNDTLARTLHPHADRWARRVAERACAAAPALAASGA